MQLRQPRLQHCFHIRRRRHRHTFADVRRVLYQLPFLLRRRFLLHFQHIPRRFRFGCRRFLRFRRVIRRLTPPLQFLAVQLLIFLRQLARRGMFQCAADRARLSGRKFTRQQARLRVEERQPIIIIGFLLPLIFLRCAGIRVLRRRCLPCFLLHVFLAAVQVFQRLIQVAILLILLLADLIGGFCALQFRFLRPPRVFPILEIIQCFLG